jgi:hypothetical protein
MNPAALRLLPNLKPKRKKNDPPTCPNSIKNAQPSNGCSLPFHRTLDHFLALYSSLVSLLSPITYPQASSLWHLPCLLSFSVVPDSTVRLDINVVMEKQRQLERMLQQVLEREFLFLADLYD